MNTKSGPVGQTPTNHSPRRAGDIAEFYAVTWLWDQGYEVFLNCGADGAIDMVAMDPSGSFRKFDVKAYHLKHRGGRSKTDKQQDIGVEFIWFDPETRALAFSVPELRKKVNRFKATGRGLHEN